MNETTTAFCSRKKSPKFNSQTMVELQEVTPDIMRIIFYLHYKRKKNEMKWYFMIWLEKLIKGYKEWWKVYLQCNVEEYHETAAFKQNPLWNRFSFVGVKQRQIASHSSGNQKYYRKIAQCNCRISWKLANDTILASYWCSSCRL